MPSRRIRSSIRQSLIRMDTELQRELLAEIQAAGQDLTADFRKVTGNWTHKPQFDVSTVISVQEIAVRVTPKRNKAGLIWMWLDQGTGKWGKRRAAYPILPKPPNTVLTFRAGYSPKTSVNAKGISGYGGIGRATGGWVKTKAVMHPGIKPRRFSAVFADRLKPPFSTRIENAMRRAIRRAAQ